MALAELIRQLGQDIGLPDLDVDSERRAVRLIFADDLEVEFEEPGAEHLFYVYAVVGPVLLNTSGTFFLEVMNANLFGRDTGGASFGYDASRQELVLFMRFHSHEISYTTFRKEIENFLAALKKWRADLKNITFPSGETIGTTTSGQGDPVSLIKV
jgi:hypothetical protein